jgi:dTDP-4-dehydrorhamnose reductase
VVAQPGWWGRDCRFFFHEAGGVPGFTEANHGTAGGGRGAQPRAAAAQGCAEPAGLRGRPLLIAGKTGTLGRAFARICSDHAIDFVVLDRTQMDIGDHDSVERAIERWQPWAVVNAAGYVRVDDAERDEQRCFRENAIGAANLARACAARNLPLLTFSSDLVFGGEKRAPYLESDRTSPLNAYGRSKAAAERMVLAACPSALVVRTSAFFGPWDEYNFAAQALASWENDRPFEADPTQLVTPTYVPGLVRSCLDLLVDGERGLWHISNPDPVTWWRVATALADLTGRPHEMIVVPSSRQLPAARPANSALASERGSFLPSLQECLQRFLNERAAQRDVIH